MHNVAQRQLCNSGCNTHFTDDYWYDWYQDDADALAGAYGGVAMSGARVVLTQDVQTTAGFTQQRMHRVQSTGASAASAACPPACAGS